MAPTDKSNWITWRPVSCPTLRYPFVLGSLLEGDGSSLPSPLWSELWFEGNARKICPCCHRKSGACNPGVDPKPPVFCAQAHPQKGLLFPDAAGRMSPAWYNQKLLTFTRLYPDVNLLPVLMSEHWERMRWLMCQILPRGFSSQSWNGIPCLGNIFEGRAEEREDRMQQPGSAFLHLHVFSGQIFLLWLNISKCWVLSPSV